MGFYGNITNASTTNLVFDRTYGSKYTLMNSMKADNLFLARYALIEYDYDDSNSEVYDKFYWDGVDNDSNNILLYKASNKEVTIKLGTEADPVYSHKALNGQTEGIVLKNQIVIGKYSSNKIAFFNCVGSMPDGSAKFKQIVATNASAYERNQTVDKLIYNEPKGFDSTAWQKLYDSNTNEEVYLNIANLNSVVPDFKVSADPPTSLPNLPHFSANSGGNFYDLHMQPQWGFRVGQAEDKEKSDEKTKWTKHSISNYGDSIVQYYYNEEEAKWQPVYSYTTEEDQMKVSADIYYNAAGFDPLIRTYDKDSDNHINILPTGSSENKYVTHGSAAGKTAKDIQELRISLPIIGNIVCKLWDLIHGENRDDSETTSLQGRLNSFNNLEENAIPVVKENIISNGKLQGDTWITPYVATNENGHQIIIEHNAPSQENPAVIGGNDSEDKKTILNFGEEIILPRISYDEKGHIQSSYEFSYTLPELSLTSQEDNEGEILSDLSFVSEEGEGKFTKTYSYVGDLLLNGYVLADSYDTVPLSENDNVNTAFAKLQYQINTKTSNDSTRFDDIDQSIEDVNKRIDDLDCTDATEANKYVSAVSQEGGVISVSKVALPEIYNSSVNFVYDTENKQNIPWLFTKTSEIETKTNSALTAISNMDYNVTQANSYVSGITQTDGKINVSYTTFPNIYNAESQFSYGEEQSQTTMTIPGLFTTVYNLSKTIDNLDYVETESKDNEYIYSIKQDNGKISCSKKALPEIYNSSTTFEYAENNPKTIEQWFELVKELEGKINTLETQLASANDQITNLTERVNVLENPVEETPPVEEGGEETPTE